jgi:hypothetical protein
MWGIIKKIKMSSYLEEGGLGEAQESGAPPLAPLGLFRGRYAENVRV